MATHLFQRSDDLAHVFALCVDAGEPSYEGRSSRRGEFVMPISPCTHANQYKTDAFVSHLAVIGLKGELNPDPIDL